MEQSKSPSVEHSEEDVMAIYDQIAEDYTRRWAAIQNEFYNYSMLCAVGDVAGKRVLDMGCGGGGLARETVRLGAIRAVGFDVSSEQIRLARAVEAADPLGVELFVGDACDFRVEGEFDVVTAELVLHYARTKADFERKFVNARRHLVSGGRLVALFANFENGMMADKRYGYTTHRLTPGEIAEGDEVLVGLYDESGVEVCSFTNHHWLRTTYEAAANRAGFEVRWDVPRPSPAVLSEMGAEFWEPIANTPNHSMIIATAI